MPPSLLASQFAALEEPAAAIVVDIRQSVAEQVAQIASGCERRHDAEGSTSGGDLLPQSRISGAIRKKHLGAVNTPVYRASTILFDTVAELENAVRGTHPGVVYGLHGMPTVTDLQSAFAALEGGHAALAVPSGLAAITLALLGTTRAGDHVLVSDSVYGPTRRFCENQLKGLGVEVSYYDPLIGGDIEQLHRHNTKLVFTESPGSLTFEVQDIPAIAEAAHRRGALVMLDNTWATPLGFPSFARGVDVAVHAGTKYLGGHSDVLIGLITCSAATFPRMHRLWTDMGVAASGDDCFLALRGLRTLTLRLRQHTASALRIAEWLRDQPEVAEVIFPALPGARGHEIWKRDFTGACGLFGGRAHAGGEGAHRRHARRHAPVQDGLQLGRLREPHPAHLPRAHADGDEMGSAGAVPAPARRARGRRRSHRGPRCRVGAAAWVGRSTLQANRLTSTRDGFARSATSAMRHRFRKIVVRQRDDSVMNRRTFIGGVAGGLLAMALAVRAQQAGKVYRIGILEAIPAAENAANLDALRKGLRDLGYVEGRNLVIEYRSADGRAERFPELASELVRLKVDLIVTRGTPAAKAAKDATRTIPVLMATMGDPRAIVTSFAHPGGNVTGMTTFSTELTAKRIQLLKELVRISLASRCFKPGQPGRSTRMGRDEDGGPHPGSPG